MKVTPIRTEPFHVGTDLFQVISAVIQKLEERSIVIITSKVVSIVEGRVIPIDKNRSDKEQKDELVEKEADYFLSSSENPYGFCISVKNNTIIASAGIDESNAEGNFVFWPKDPQTSANAIRAFLQKKYTVKEVGVVITDSHVLPLRWGTHGTSIAHSGFQALNDYRGKPDIFGRSLQVSQANVAEGLAAAAVLVMGEGNEQTPIAIVQDLPFVQFQDRDPSEDELKSLAISLEEDLFTPILKKANWKKGQGGRS